MGELILILDFVAAVAVCAIAYILYKKFVSPIPQKDKAIEIAYEQGFSDAVKYFGLKKLYEDDPFLKDRMNQIFAEVGAPHRFSGLFRSEQRGQKVKT